MENQYKKIKLKNILRETFSKYDTPLEDLPKKKMGTTWFQYWMKPKKEAAGWRWEDDGTFIWISRPGSKKPTAKFEKETGLLQGHWVDDMEYQW